MIYKVDLIREVVLLIGPDFSVADAFLAEGVTTHECNALLSFYTYRSLLTLPGHCLICGKNLEQQQQPCTSSGGFHAFVGLTPEDLDNPLHLAENRSAPFQTIRFEEIEFFLEEDHLFPIEDITPAMSV